MPGLFTEVMRGVGPHWRRIVERAFETPAESEIYRNGADVITARRAVIGGQSFDLEDIETVSLTNPVLNRTYGFVAIGVGIIIATLGYFVWEAVFLTPMLGGLSLIVVGVVLAFAVRPHYTVRLNRSDGTLTRLQFPNRAQAEQVLQAVRKAAALHG